MDQKIGKCEKSKIKLKKLISKEEGEKGVESKDIRFDIDRDTCQIGSDSVTCDIVLASPSPFLLFLSKTEQVPASIPQKSTPSPIQLSYQPEDKNLLINEQGWNIKLNPSYCKLLGRIDYAEATKFIVKCQDHIDLNSKELAFPAYVLLHKDSINFWIELEKEEFNDDLVHFYNFFWSKEFKEEINKSIPKNCLFEGTYNNKYSLCLVNWTRLNNLIEFIKSNWIQDKVLREEITLEPDA